MAKGREHTLTYHVDYEKHSYVISYIGSKGHKKTVYHPKDGFATKEKALRDASQKIYNELMKLEQKRKAKT
jgi:hypothetical protein